MARGIKAAAAASVEKEAQLVVYEAGYHITPTVAEGDIEAVVSRIRAAIEKAGGAFIAEGAPQKVSLSYAIAQWNNGRWAKFDQVYFGWLKFEAATDVIAGIEQGLKADREILRHIVFKTVREDTRANVRQFVLKEVKRTDTIKSTRRVATPETKAEISDEKIDEAIEELVAD